MNTPICFILYSVPKTPLVPRLKILVALKLLLQTLLFIGLFAIHLRILVMGRGVLMSVAGFITPVMKSGACSSVMTLYPKAKPERIKVKNLFK